jgi:hypothetical protein
LVDFVKSPQNNFYMQLSPGSSPSSINNMQR